jgi:hypothetical protein
LERAKQIPEWTAYDKQVAELAQRLLRKDANKKGGNETLVDESMFEQIDASPPKDPPVDTSESMKRKKEEL